MSSIHTKLSPETPKIETDIFDFASNSFKKVERYKLCKISAKLQTTIERIPWQK